MPTVYTEADLVGGGSFAWKEGSRLRAKPHVAAEEMHRIIAQRGVVNPHTLVDESRDPDAALHNEFEWDDAVAGEKYRVVQAREIIRFLVLIPPVEAGEEPKPPIRWIQKLTSDDPEEDRIEYQPNNYISLPQVMTNDDNRHAMVRQAFKALQAWYARYHAYAEFARIFEAIEQTEKELHGEEELQAA